MDENKPKPGTYAYNRKYAEKWEEKQEDVRLRLPKGQKAIWQSAAKNAGESLNSYIITSVKNRMNKKEEG